MARGVGVVVVWQRVVGMTHVVGVDGVGAMAIIVRGSPSPEVHIVVVGHKEVDGTMGSGVGVVGRHAPDKVGGAAKVVEAQVAGGAVQFAVSYQPDTSQVEGHIDFFSGVGVIAINPELAIDAVDTLGPHFVNQDVCLKFVFVAAIDDQFALFVQEFDGALCLSGSKVANLVGGCSECKDREQQC